MFSQVSTKSVNVLSAWCQEWFIVKRSMKGRLRRSLGQRPCEYTSPLPAGTWQEHVQKEVVEMHS